MLRLVAVAAAPVAALVFALSLATGSSTANAAAPSVTGMSDYQSAIPASAAGTVVPPVARQRAIDYARGLKLAFPQIDRIDARLTTWGEWNRLRAVSQSMNGHSPSTLVWVVGVAGDSTFFLNGGMSVKWTGLVLDATTGAVLAAEGGIRGEPAYFSTLVDLAPR